MYDSYYVYHDNMLTNCRKIFRVQIVTQFWAAYGWFDAHHISVITNWLVFYTTQDHAVKKSWQMWDKIGYHYVIIFNHS